MNDAINALVSSSPCIESAVAVRSPERAQAAVIVSDEIASPSPIPSPAGGRASGRCATTLTGDRASAAAPSAGSNANVQSRRIVEMRRMAASVSVGVPRMPQGRQRFGMTCGRVRI